MKLLVTACLCVMFVIGAMCRSGAAETRAQNDDGMVIYGTVMVPGTREPVSGVEVWLCCSRNEPGPVQLFGQPYNRTIVTTDIQGRFSFSELPADRYEVGLVTPAVPDNPFGGLLQHEVNLTEGALPPDLRLWARPRSTVSGQVLFPNGNPAQDVFVSLVEVVYREGRRRIWYTGLDGASAQTNDEGVYSIEAQPGEYYLRVSLDEGPIYYPGVPFAEDAAVLTVPGSIDLPLIDVLVPEADRFRVRFGVQRPETNSPVADIVEGRLQPIGRSRIAEDDYPIELEWLGEARFETLPLAPGEYELFLRYPKPVRQSDAPFAAVKFTVTDEDLDLGTIGPSARSDIAGRVVIEAPGNRLADVPRFNLVPSPPTGFTVRSSATGNDGTILSEEVPPGLFRFSTEGMPQGWYVRTAATGGRDILKDGLESDGSSVSLVQVVIAVDAARITGVTRDVVDALTPDARIVLVPAPSRRGPMTQFPTTLADSAGAYVLEDMPPGEYRILALDTAGQRKPPFYWEDPEFLREYEFRGTLITVDPGARMVINPETILLSD